jgi:large subunit ribosomal protein L32
MACPKRRKSRSKQKMRQHANRWLAPKLNKCSSCGGTKPGHVACPSCGYYRERQVLDISVAA